MPAYRKRFRSRHAACWVSVLAGAAILCGCAGGRSPGNTEEARLTGVLLTARDPDDRVQAARALAKHQGPVSSDALMQALASDPDWQVVSWSARTLGHRRYRKAVPLLLVRLHDPDAWVRNAAAVALGRIGDKAATAALIPLLGDPGFMVARSAAQALGALGDPAAVEALVQTLPSQEPDGRAAAAARALGRIGDLRVVGPLKAALGAADSELRWEAALALGKIDPQGAGVALATLLADNQVPVRRAALWSLRQGGSAPREALLERLHDRDDIVRVRAARLLAAKGWLTAAHLGLLQRDPSWRVRLEAAELVEGARQLTGYTRPSLGTGQGVAGIWTAGLDDRSPVVRAGAARALGLQHADSAVPVLAKRLSDRDPHVRGEVAQALGAMESQQAVWPLLRAASGDSDRGVRRAAVWALARLTGEDFGSDLGRWKEWSTLSDYTRGLAR